MEDNTTISTGISSRFRDKGICWECLGIPTSRFFESIVSDSHHRDYGFRFVSTWENIRKRCALCDSLMAHFGVLSESGDDESDFTQSAKGEVRCVLSHLYSRGTDFPCLRIEFSGKTIWFARSGILRFLPADLRDITLAKNWISECLQWHKNRCGHDNSSSFPLKVIDCASRELCEIAPGTPYVCLSYVWGNASVTHETSPILSGYVPKTIEDSLWVTLQLGYLYLWIDRYCINQQNDAEKHHLITNMDAVYRGAALTIVAAAGDNPHSGLPGINGTVRRQLYRHKVETSDQEIIGLELPKSEIGSSVWNTRGWTFQELVLSRRRLVFTRSQMYFQCNTMHGVESLYPREVVPRNLRSDPAPWEESSTRYFAAFSNLDEGPMIEVLYWQMEEYYQRGLSFREDIIKAITGIINAFELPVRTDRVRATHVFGLPIFYSQTSDSFCLPTSERFGSAVFTPTSTFVRSLMWYLRRKNGMRDDTVTETLFPSWSWASARAHYDSIGLDGFVWNTALANLACEETLQVWVHDERGMSLELDHYIKARSKEDDRLLVPMISIRSWVVSCNAKRYQYHGYRVSGFAGGWLQLDYPETPPSDDLVAIYLGSTLSWHTTDEVEERRAVLLVVERVNNSAWRRIGVLKEESEKVSRGGGTLAWLNRIRRKGGWEMRTLCLV